MVQSSERISLWWAVMGSRVNAAGTESKRQTTGESACSTSVNERPCD